MRVELVGGLGVGKSTLARSFEIIGFNCIYEDLDANPFLAGAFGNAHDFRFPSQMWFALSKFYEVKGMERPDLINIMDQGLLNVRAYSKMLFRGGDGVAQALLTQCFDYLEAQMGPPDLIVHLTCSPAEQMQRIRGRNRDHEANISMGYIAELQNEIGQMVTRLKVEGQPVLAVNTDEVDLRSDMRFAENLARLIAGIVFEPAARPRRARPIPANDKTPLLQYVEMAEAM